MKNRIFIGTILMLLASPFSGCKKRPSNPDYIETSQFSYTEPVCRSVFWTDLYCKADIGDLESSYKNLAVTITDTITKLHFVNTNFSQVYGDLYIKMKSWTGSINVPLKFISPALLKNKEATMIFTDFSDHFQSNNGGVLHLKKLSDTRFEAIICSETFSEVSYPSYNGKVSFIVKFDR